MKESAILRTGGALLAALYLSACATATIRPDGGTRVGGKPAYQETKNYFFWGLKGEHEIDVAAICKEKGVEQMQSQMTFVNGLLSAITLGIYAPRTAKVWCK